MRNRSGSHAIKFVKLVVLDDKGNEVRLTVVCNIGLSSNNCVFVLVQDVLAVLEEFTSCIGVDIGAVELEVLQVRVSSDDFRVLFEGIESDVEERDCSTCISCVLLHEEDIVWCIFRLQTSRNSLFVLLLHWSNLIEEENAEHRLGNHLKCPLLSGEHFRKGKELSLEPHFLDELVDDFGVGLQRHPVLTLLFSLLLHGYA